MMVKKLLGVLVALFVINTMVQTNAILSLQDAVVNSNQKETISVSRQNMQAATYNASLVKNSSNSSQNNSLVKGNLAQLSLPPNVMNMRQVFLDNNTNPDIEGFIILVYFPDDGRGGCGVLVYNVLPGDPGAIGHNSYLSGIPDGNGGCGHLSMTSGVNPGGNTTGTISLKNNKGVISIVGDTTASDVQFKLFLTNYLNLNQVTGKNDNTTINAIKKFQSNHKISMTGFYGVETRSTLGSEISKIKINTITETKLGSN